MIAANIIENVTRHISLSDKEKELLNACLVRRVLRKKEFLLVGGEMCKHINFVENGVLRAYYKDKDDNESIIMFAISDWWITDMYSFATGNKAMLHIDALEDSVVLQLSKTDLDNLFEKIPQFEKFFRIIMQNSYIREQLRAIQNLSMSAEERYTNFLNKYPQFAQRVPLKQIASYLGMTPEFLSVVRKKKR